MPLRYRLKEHYGPKGSWRRFGEVNAGGIVKDSYDRCDDYTDKGDCHDLYIAKTRSEGGHLHSKYDPGYWGSYWQQYRCDIFDDPDMQFPHWNSSLEGNKTVNEFAVDLLKRTNPSVPYVDIPVAVLELADVVQLIKDTGTTLIKKAARNNLKLQFGLLPLIGDINKLTLFDKHLAKRMQVFEKLKTANGYRRSVNLAQFTGSASVFKWMQSVGGLYGLNFNQVTNRKFRGHVRWMPDFDFSSLDKAGLVDLACSAALGSNWGLSTLWEALPWTWLLDWGSNVGDYFQATRNSINVSPHDILIMTETTTFYESPAYENSDITLSKSRVARKEKRRQRATPTVAAQMPFLSANQLGILASLAVLRR